jgi:hypothetical protein
MFFYFIFILYIVLFHGSRSACNQDSSRFGKKERIFFVVERFTVDLECEAHRVEMWYWSAEEEPSPLSCDLLFGSLSSSIFISLSGD